MTYKTSQIFIFICILICTSCYKTKKEDYSDLNILLELNPQKGLDSVKSIINNYNGNDEYHKMKLSLLKYKGEDKCYVLHSSDSIIKDLYDYFDKEGTVGDKMEVNYYMGSTYRDMHNYPLAISYYNEAVNIGENNIISHTDSMLLANIYSQLSWMNGKANNPSISLDQMKHALQIRQQLKTDDAASYQDVANVYYTLGNMDSAYNYYSISAIKMANSHSIKDNIDYIGDHLQFYTRINNHKLAKISLDQILTIDKDSIPPYILAKVAIYYSELENNTDSCIYYIELAWKNEHDNETKAVYARMLSESYAEKGDMNKAYEYANIHYIYEDSAKVQDLAEETSYAQNQFKAQELDIIRNSLKEKLAKRNKYIAYGIAIVSNTLAILCFMLYIQSKKKKGYKADIQKLESDNVRITEEHNKLTEIVNADKMLRAECTKDISTVMDSINAIEYDPKETLTEDQWESVFLAVDKLHPQFRKHVLSYFPAIKNKELIIIYLVKLGLKQADIARIFNYSRTVAHRNFHRIEEILGTRISDVIDSYKD
ncbi:MAG: transposase family protein [Bacteroidaceae bacterium]|nr:transposase family protein [Bacteroidaceae bacterium]